ncbi:hypothetical protein B0H14DRAFT_2617592 [Mycena olivaceomarginata]|nr:hypothetical protein B0H14DRAFT_2617592 [Mycena olivaceomarginata]
MGDLRLPGWAHIEQRPRALQTPARPSTRDSTHLNTFRSAPNSSPDVVTLVPTFSRHASSSTSVSVQLALASAVAFVGAKHRAHWGVGEREALDEGFHSAVDRGPEVDGGKQAWKDIAYLAAAINIIACGCASSRGLRRTQWRRWRRCWYEGGVRGKGGGAASEDE